MVRVAAWFILRSGSATPLREVDAAARARELDGRDRALLRHLIGVEVRHRGTLRALVRHFAHHKLKPDLVAHLHLGLAQIFFLDRVPDHAAVSETLGAVHDTVGPSKVRVVNAILRNAIRARRAGLTGDPRRDVVGRELHLHEPVFRDPDEHPLLWAEDALSMPAQLMKRWTKRFGRERARELALASSREPALVVRGVGIDRDEARRLLASLDVETTDGHHPAALRCAAEHTERITSSPPFREGRLTIQGESALAAAELLQPSVGERLLDLCAAPGGKTAVLAEAGASVVAVDVDPERLKKVCSTVERLGLSERVELLESDGTAALDARELDGALIDAPCTNTGVLGARPGARWRFGPESLRSLGELQSRLLREGAERVRAGGRLVWSTCSLEPEENGQRVRAFLEGRAEWELEEERDALPGPDGPLDGGYAARIRHRA